MINKSASGQMVYCRVVDKYLENIPRSKMHHICSTAVHPELLQKLLTATITEGERDVLHSVRCGNSVFCNGLPKGMTRSENYTSSAQKVHIACTVKCKCNFQVIFFSHSWMWGFAAFYLSYLLGLHILGHHIGLRNHNGQLISLFLSHFTERLID